MRDAVGREFANGSIDRLGIADIKLDSSGRGLTVLVVRADEPGFREPFRQPATRW